MNNLKVELLTDPLLGFLVPLCLCGERIVCKKSLPGRSSVKCATSVCASKAFKGECYEKSYNLPDPDSDGRGLVGHGFGAGHDRSGAVSALPHAAPPRQS